MTHPYRITNHALARYAERRHVSGAARLLREDPAGAELCRSLPDGTEILRLPISGLYAVTQDGYVITAMTTPTLFSGRAKAANPARRGSIKR